MTPVPTLRRSRTNRVPTVTFVFSRCLGLPLTLSLNCHSYFVGYLFQEGLSARMVKGYLSAVRHAQISLGLGDPRMGDMPQLEYHIKGLRKLSSGRQQSRLPITIDILRYLRSSWEKSPGHFDGTMLWAACCMCFFGFLRSGEIVVPADSAYDRAYVQE